MQFDPTEIRGNIVCAEAGDQTKPGGTFISKHQTFILKDDLSLRRIKYGAFNQ